MKKAFTLIELLVVIAIIAILAAILFPVFAQAKSAAKNTQNLSNVKQVVLAELMYAGDVDGTFHSQFNHDSLNDYGEWQFFLQPYMKNRQIVYDVNRTRLGGDTYIDPTGRMIGFAPNFGTFHYRGGTGAFGVASASFELCRAGGSPECDTGRMWPGKSLSAATEPANHVAFVTTADSPMYTNSYYYQTEDGQNKEPRNGGKWVRSFIDGHAKSVMYGAYTILGTYIQMPKSLTDANGNCWDIDAIQTQPTDGGTQPFDGMKCGDINAYLVANRLAY